MVNARQQILDLFDAGRFDGATLQQIADEIGVTRQRVHQIVLDVQLRDRAREVRGLAPKRCECLRKAVRSGLCAKHLRQLKDLRRRQGEAPGWLSSLAGAHVVDARVRRAAA